MAVVSCQRHPLFIHVCNLTRPSRSSPRPQHPVALPFLKLNSRHAHASFFRLGFALQQPSTLGAIVGPQQLGPIKMCVVKNCSSHRLGFPTIPSQMQRCKLPCISSDLERKWQLAQRSRNTRPCRRSPTRPPGPLRQSSSATQVSRTPACRGSGQVPRAGMGARVGAGVAQARRRAGAGATGRGAGRRPRRGAGAWRGAGVAGALAPALARASAQAPHGRHQGVGVGSGVGPGAPQALARASVLASAPGLSQVPALALG